MIWDNPEFKRYLWLELSPVRLVIMPITLSLLFALYLLIASDSNGLEMDFSWQLQEQFGVRVFYVLVFLWGARQAADAVWREVADHTWDWQRLSSLSPWTLTWGKLLGSSIFSWYGALLCLLLAAHAMVNNDLLSWDRTLILLIWLLLCGIMAQALSLLTSTQSAMKVGSVSKRHVSVHFFIGLAVLPIAIIGFEMLRASPEEREIIQWYTYTIDLGLFFFFSGLFYCFWAVVGAARTIGQALKTRETFSVWAIFVILTLLYVGGFFYQGIDAMDMPLHGVSRIGLVLFGMTLFSISLTQIVALIEAKDIMVFRAMHQGIEQKNWLLVWQVFPCWGQTLLVSAVVLIIALIFPSLEQITLEGRLYEVGMLQWSIVGVFFLLLRDMGVLVLLHLLPKIKRPDSAMLFYLVMVYIVLPSFVDVAGLTYLTVAFFPYKQGFAPTYMGGSLSSSAIAVGVPLFEALVVWQFSWQHWQQRFALQK
ncbi:hypothetical protein ACQZV8_12015 [Magnetococcales bacterium HHB-1]